MASATFAISDYEYFSTAAFIGTLHPRRESEAALPVWSVEPDEDRLKICSATPMNHKDLSSVATEKASR